MKLELDENIPVELIDDLRGAGHDGDSVQDEGLAGAYPCWPRILQDASWS
jgi:hypothetical protein